MKFLTFKYLLISLFMVVLCVGYTMSQTISMATIIIDATSGKSISPYIYGSNFPDWEKLGVNVPVARQGGNRMTAYNWETNASNAGADWHHQNDDHMGKTDEAGWTVRNFLESAQKNNAAVILTIPCTGYVAADKKGDGDVNRSPDYLNIRFLKSLSAKPNEKYVYPPDTTDKFVYQDEFVDWIEKIKSPKTPVWYALDNEPDIWHGTHVRIRPDKLTYAEIISINSEYAMAIKKISPDTFIFGPVNYGWNGFRTFQDAPDGKDRDFLNVYLDAMKEIEEKSGKRLLDVLDIHWYPEARGDGVRISTGRDNPGTPAVRIQTPRSLWDPTYVEESWITRDALKGEPIVLLPRVLKQIEEHYPGTKLAITEYNYGGGRVVSGALAQADVLGLFGRYGVFAACNWGLSPGDTAQIAAFKSFLDYDGKGSRFGDLGLSVQGEKADSNSIYASLDSKDSTRLTMMIINKTEKESPMLLFMNGFRGSKVKVWGISAEDFTRLTEKSAFIKKGVITFKAPALSVTTLEIKK